MYLITTPTLMFLLYSNNEPSVWTTLSIYMILSPICDYLFYDIIQFYILLNIFCIIYILNINDFVHITIYDYIIEPSKYRINLFIKYIGLNKYCERHHKNIREVYSPILLQNPINISNKLAILLNLDADNKYFKTNIINKLNNHIKMTETLNPFKSMVICTPNIKKTFDIADDNIDITTFYKLVEKQFYNDYVKKSE